MLKKIRDTFLVFILVATSGFYYFYFSIEYIIIGVIIVAAYFFILNKWNKLDIVAIALILLFPLWESTQFFFLGGFEFRPVLGTFTRFFFAYGVLKIVDKNFIPSYVRVIYFFAVISLFFYALFYIPNITNSLIEFSNRIKPLFAVKDTYGVVERPDIVIFNFHGYELNPKRNSGPFWEPGAFAIFLNLALYLNILKSHKLFNLKNLIFILSIISTYSTTGILVLFVTMTWYFYQLRIKLFFRLIFLIPTVMLFFNVYTDYDFLGKKVEENIENAPLTTSSRFGSALADYYLFKDNPLLGYGRNIEAKYGLSYFDKSFMHRNNGLTSFIIQWGILLGFLYFYLYYISFRNIVKYYSIKTRYTTLAGFTLLMLCGFSQGIFQYPFFHALMLLGLVVYKPSELKPINRQIQMGPPANGERIGEPAEIRY